MVVVERKAGLLEMMALRRRKIIGVRTGQPSRSFSKTPCSQVNTVASTLSFGLGTIIDFLSQP